MPTVLDNFKAAKDAWTNKKVVIDKIPGGWKKNEAFHVAYHAINSPASRNIYTHKVPDTDDFGNVVVFLHKTNQFNQLEATDRGVEITSWCHDEIAEKIDEIMAGFKEKIEAFMNRVAASADTKLDVMRTLQIEQRVDELINSAMLVEKSGVVYFNIGKVREYAANIPLLMNAPGMSLVQLSMNKWMTAGDQLRQKSPDEPFPQDRIKPLIGDALKWKKFIMDFLDGAW